MACCAPGRSSWRGTRRRQVARPMRVGRHDLACLSVGLGDVPPRGREGLGISQRVFRQKRRGWVRGEHRPDDLLDLARTAPAPARRPSQPGCGALGLPCLRTLAARFCTLRDGGLDQPFVATHPNIVAGGPATQCSTPATRNAFWVGSRAIDSHRWAGRSGEGETR
jgi:hypothetical protein